MKEHSLGRWLVLGIAAVLIALASFSFGRYTVGTPLRIPTLESPTPVAFYSPTATSQPTMTPGLTVVSRTPIPTPAATGPTTVKILSVQGGRPGALAAATVQTGAFTPCTIQFVMPHNAVSDAPGLFDQIAMSNGQINWFWTIGTNAEPGSGVVTVTCNGVSASEIVTIQQKL